MKGVSHEGPPGVTREAQISQENGAKIHDSEMLRGSSWKQTSKHLALGPRTAAVSVSGYDIDTKMLGEGSYGTVSICTSKATKQKRCPRV